VAEGVEGEAAQGGAGFDTGARHYRDTKQVKNDLKAIQGAHTSCPQLNCTALHLIYFYFYLYLTMARANTGRSYVRRTEGRDS
jgi:hypothetical protein